MKKLTFAFLTAAFIAATAFSAEAQPKIASVNMEKLFNGYWKNKQSTTILDDRTTSYVKDLKSMAADLDKAEAAYKQLLEQANDPLISADEREKRKSAAADKSKDVNNSKAAIDQYQRQAQTSLNELKQRLNDNLHSEIQKAVGVKAKAGGYAFVLDSTAISGNGTPAVLYADPAYDMTEAVLKDLNAGAPLDVLKANATLPTNLKPNSH
jgi:outer membrane protein